MAGREQNYAEADDLTNIILERHSKLQAEQNAYHAGIVSARDILLAADDDTGASADQIQIKEDEEGLTSEGSSESDESSSDDDSSPSSDDDDNDSSSDEESDHDPETIDENVALLGDHQYGQSHAQSHEGEDIGAGWTRYIDTQSGHEYFFNHVSGASQWHRPKLGPPQIRHATSVQPVSAHQVFPRQEGDNYMISKRHTGMKNLEAKRYFSGDDSNASAEGSDLDSDEESVDMSDVDADVEDADFIRGKSDVVRAVNFYVWSSIFHVVCIEGPAAAFEAFFRGFYLLLTGAVLTAAQQPYALGRGRMKQGLRLLIAFLTLLIPGSLLLAYSDLIRAWKDGRLARSAHVDDWTLGTLPTLAGPLDAHILRVVSLGQGANARSLENIYPAIRAK